MLGEGAISHTVQSGGKIRLPRGFGTGCCTHCFHVVSTDALRKSLTKAFYSYIRALRDGATTKCGMLGGAYPLQRRSKGGSTNALKCPELGQLLYDWFIDCLKLYKARTTNHLIMRQARELHARLQTSGYSQQSLPNLTGNAGTYVHDTCHGSNVGEKGLILGPVER